MTNANAEELTKTTSSRDDLGFDYQHSCYDSLCFEVGRILSGFLLDVLSRSEEL